MKKLTYALALCGLATVSSVALADDAPAATPAAAPAASPLTGNIGIATDYLFRGLSQSQHQPEISGGFDYTHSSGLYVGTWLSNQAWVETAPYKSNSSLEWDLYGGYRGSLPADFGYDVGMISYYYPGNRSGAAAGAPTPDTVEAYASLSWKMLSLKYSQAVSDYFVGWGVDGVTKTKGSNYLELNATQDLGSGWGVLGHVGHQKVKNVSDANYTDWKVGVTKDVGYGTVTLAYSKTDAHDTSYTWAGKKVGDGRVVLSFGKTF
jgi:uncharacterized protein (TIGR02001 family)